MSAQPTVPSTPSTPGLPPPPLLSVAVQRKRLGGQWVLQQLALQLQAGEVVTLVGASGCGKSTLLRLIAGLDTDFEGTLALHGRPLQGLSREIRLVFQEPRLLPWLTVAQNVAFDLGLGQEQDPRVADMLREVGLQGLAHALPKQLSGGQAQRVAMARGLVTRPALLLLDEPFSAVDAFTRLKLQDVLLQVARAHGVTVLMVTHDLQEAVRLSDRVLVMAARPGRVHEVLPIALPHPRGPADDELALGPGARLRQALQAVHAF